MIKRWWGYEHVHAAQVLRTQTGYEGLFKEYDFGTLARNRKVKVPEGQHPNVDEPIAEPEIQGEAEVMATKAWRSSSTFKKNKKHAPIVPARSDLES